jgi:hypothetical protein
MRPINYSQILEHVTNMINTLEYDSMRSPGKAKINAETLVHLYMLKDRYESQAVVAPTVKKEEAVVEAPVKKPVTRTSKVTDK